MNRKNLKIAWRFLLKNKTHTVINIIGLGLGFSVSVLMMIFVYHQLSFDTFHENSDRIYRLTVTGSMADGKVLSAALTTGEAAYHISEEVPEAEEACRVYDWGISEVVVDDIRFTNDKVLWVDSNFFRVFTFEWLTGNQATALREPFSAVITKSTAKKYFADSDPLNQSMRIRGLDYRITGLMPDPPANSHIRFDILVSFHTLERPGYDIVERSGISFPTYVMKREGADPEQFKTKTTSVADHYLNTRYEPFGIAGKHSLQPLNKVYLHSDFNFDMAARGDIRHVYVFAFLALAVIVIAVFNFVNLVTAQSEKRMREIGMRKVMGAFRKDLILQFIGESVLVAVVAFLLSLVINELLINEVSSALDVTLRHEYWYNPVMLVSIILLVLLTGVIAGLYPALHLSGFQPIVVLKGLTRSSVAGLFIRKVLVIFQFGISIFLITTVLLLNRQVHYMQHKDLGFEREHVVSVRGITESIRNAYPVLREELLQHPNILYVSGSQGVPGENMSFQNCRRSSDTPEASIMIYENRIRHNYLETFGMRIVEGRDFDPEMRTDTAAIILNQTAVQKLGLENPIGKEIVIWQHTGRVIGVVADFNFLSLHNEIDPFAFTMYDPWINRINIRFQPNNISETMSRIQERLEQADPNYSFEYFFVDDLFAGMYRHEEHINKLTLAAAIIAILISFMGLFALTSFSVQKRIKEIGIRKVLGASLPRILLLLFRDMWLWVLIGCAVAWPLAAYVVLRWQENFAFTINVFDYWYLFVAAGALAALVGTLAAFSQAWAASRTNPVHSLKAE
ncbi:MAG: FtsX-like permease family protein [Bacteroidales bacterium]|nr:FtsX-like permease family protein [Bacteroidales bacterium]